MKNKDLLALAALAGGLYGINQAGRNAKFRNDMNKSRIEERGERLKFLADDLREERSRQGVSPPTRAERAALPPPVNMKDVVSTMSPEEVSASFLTDSRGQPVSTGTGDFVRRQSYKKGGAVKAKSASARADGIAKRGKTKGRIV
jgi:hypothetical protein